MLKQRRIIKPPTKHKKHCLVQPAQRPCAHRNTTPMSLPNFTKQTKRRKFFQGSNSPVNTYKRAPNPILNGLVWSLILFVIVFLSWMFTKIALGIPAFSTLPTVYEVGNGVAVFD